MPKTISLDEIAALVGCVVAPGVRRREFTGVASLAQAGPNDVSFLSSDAFLKQFHSTRAGAVLVHKKVKLPASGASLALGAAASVVDGPVVLRVDDADLAMSAVLEKFSQPVARPAPGIDPQARVHASADCGSDISIGPFSTVGRDTKIGRGTLIHPHVYIGDQVTIGENCEIFPNVTIRSRISIGNRVIIHAGSVLGTDGFGYRWDGAKHAKVPQIGTVIIEDDVEIGSCVCIDRARFSATQVGRGTKIDNLVQIAHNVIIGPHCILVGQAGLAGSAVLGTGVVLGGQVAIRDHITLGDGSMVAACGAVADDVPPGAIVSGTPALPHRQTLREQAALRRLPDLVVQIRKLQEQIDRMEQELAQSRPAVE